MSVEKKKTFSALPVSVWKRVVARLVDVGVLYVPLAISLAVVALVYSHGSEPAAPVYTPLVMLVSSFFNEVVLVSQRGQNLGKMVVGHKIVNVADGRIPSFVTAFLRWFFIFWPTVLSELALFFNIDYMDKISSRIVLAWTIIIGLSLLVFGKEGKSLVDKLLNSRVIYKSIQR